MSNLKRTPHLFFLFIAVCFLIGLWRLFGLTFESGELYPAYSSLKTDPLGSKALYESLNLIKNLEVSRNYGPLSKLPEGRDRVLFFLGLAHDDLENTPKNLARNLDRFVQEGGRMILAFGPSRPPTLEYGEDDSDREDEKSGGKRERESWKEDPDEEGEPKDRDYISLADHWGLKLETNDKADTGNGLKALRRDKSGLPAKTSWHSALYFDKIDKPWKVIYTADNKPVVIEKPYGKGSLVLATDSYLFSNEAMRKERLPALLIWFVGSGTKIIFDETHFSIVKSEGVATLVRRFRMQWFLIGFLLMAALFIWKQMTPFIPPQSREADPLMTNITQGRDYVNGLINLLQNHIRIQSALNVCHREWSKTHDADQRATPAEAEEVQEIMRRYDAGIKERDPVKAYHAIHEILDRAHRHAKAGRDKHV